MSVLVTGGSGYIGAHIVRQLRERGDAPVVVDDFETGRRDRIAGIPSFDVDLAEPEATRVLRSVIADHGVTAIVHLAARKQAGASVQHPLEYYRDNTRGLVAVLEAARDGDVRDLVFSSSAAVYGEATADVDEDAPLAPANPYGRTKLIGEWLVAAAARAHGLRAVSLRYFNVAGAQWPDLADTARLNLIPMVLGRLRDGQPARIFGDDYDTPDGTCIRDFVHVADVADAHLAVLDALPRQREPHRVFNVGTGVGTSVREIVDGLRARLPGSPPAIVLPRREGDPPRVVGNTAAIRRALDWRARHSINEVLDSAVARGE